jgi:hypothetical protein
MGGEELASALIEMLFSEHRACINTKFGIKRLTCSHVSDVIVAASGLSQTLEAADEAKAGVEAPPLAAVKTEVLPEEVKTQVLPEPRVDFRTAVVEQDSAPPPPPMEEQPGHESPHGDAVGSEGEDMAVAVAVMEAKQ